MTEEVSEYKFFRFDVPMDITKITLISDPESTLGGKAANYSVPRKADKRAVALIGDRFMKGQFLPAVELEKAHKEWEGTLHDINHQGVQDARGFMVSSNILYFVGYNKNVTYDTEAKSVSMDIVPNESTMYASAWKAYIQLCEEAGQVPNVSVAFRGKVKSIKAKELPAGVNYSLYGYSKEDYVEYIYDIHPEALSTVWKGACNDEDGCGVGKCNLQNDEPDVDEDVDKEKQALIDWLESHKEEN